jgi:hypothetical protein
MRDGSMSALHYIVSQQCPIYGDEWAERAAFRWFADARAYALRTSKADIDDRFVRVEREGFEPNYFLRGQAADHLYEEVEA